MQIEVEQSGGFYLNASVKDISVDSFNVSYENGWRKPEWVEFGRCRAIIDSSGTDENQQPIKIGDVVDAYVRYQVYKRAWQMMKVIDIQNCFASVKGIEDMTIIDTVPIAFCRNHSLSKQINASSINIYVIPVGDLFEYFKNNEERYKLMHGMISGIWINLDKERQELIIKALAPSIIEDVKVKEVSFLKNCRQMMALTQEPKRTSCEPIIEAPHIVKFDLSTKISGMTIVSHRPYIEEAFKIDGIINIILDERLSDQGYYKFKIYANNIDAAEHARNMLKISEQVKLVPEVRVGRLVGKNGVNIQNIIDNSGLVRIVIGDENAEGMVPITFIGTREALITANEMVDFRLNQDRISRPDLELIEKDYTPDDFLIAAKMYYGKNDTIQTSEKLWMSAVYSVKLLFLEVHVNITSSNCFKNFVDFAINQTAFFDKSSLFNGFKAAKRFHNYSYASKHLLAKKFQSEMTKVEKFVANFKHIKPDEVRNNLQSFLNNQDDFVVIDKEGDIHISGKKYHFKKICY